MLKRTAKSARVVKPARTGFQSDVERWAVDEPLVESAVVFGSSARQAAELASADDWSDVDLHIGTSDPAALERIDWRRALPTQRFCVQVVRPATGGVRKATVLFVEGQIDLVLVPVTLLRSLRRSVGRGDHLRPGVVRAGLNELNTCLRSGHRFLKGERTWGEFYAQVLADLPGVRLGDAEAVALADGALCDLWWILQKIDRGEFLAAQQLLHRSLAETNFRLIRELILRRGDPLPSFGLGRRLEQLLPARELAWVRVESRLNRRELSAAAARAHEGLVALMGRLVPTWRVPPDFGRMRRSRRG